MCLPLHGLDNSECSQPGKHWSAGSENSVNIRCTLFQNAPVLSSHWAPRCVLEGWEAIFGLQSSYSHRQPKLLCLMELQLLTCKRPNCSGSLFWNLHRGTLLFLIMKLIIINGYRLDTWHTSLNYFPAYSPRNLVRQLRTSLASTESRLNRCQVTAFSKFSINVDFSLVKRIRNIHLV